MKRPPPSSVVLRLRVLVIGLLATTAIVAALAVLALRTASADLEERVDVLVPTYLDARDVLRNLTAVNTAVIAAASSGGEVAFPDVAASVDAADTALQAVIDSGVGSEEAVSALVEEHRAAIGSWSQYAEELPNVDSELDAAIAELTARFAVVQSTNTALVEELRRILDRDWARSERQLERWTWAIVVVTAATGAIAAISARRTAFALSRPLEKLRDVVRLQRDGETELRASETEGALEVRQLAEDFNQLTEERELLRQGQSAGIVLRELTLDIAASLRDAESDEEAMAAMCERLGSALGVDRCGVFGGVGETWSVMHVWRRDGVTAVQGVNDELLRQATAMILGGPLSRDVQVIPDMADPAGIVGERGRAIATFVRIRALLTAPIFVDGKVSGILGLTMDGAPRQWTADEVYAVRQAAAHASQSLAERAYVTSLKALDKQKSDFLATASHELRTPLTSIAGYVELLEDGDLGELSAQQRRAVDVIHRNATRLRGLIEDLLVLNRIEGRGLSANFDRVDVAVLLHRVGDVLGPIADDAGVDLAMPAGEGQAWVEGDADQLERALTNVIGNALKFTPAGGKATITSTVTTDDEGQTWVRVCCADTGVGVPAEELSLLSTRFFRASNATAGAVPGTGLGLAIVRSIVELHGGSMSITSEEGVGTTVTLVLPTLPVEQVSVPATTPS